MVMQGRTLVVTAVTMETVVMVVMVAMQGAEVNIAKNVNNMIV